MITLFIVLGVCLVYVLGAFITLLVLVKVNGISMSEEFDILSKYSYVPPCVLFWPFTAPVMLAWAFFGWAFSKMFATVFRIINRPKKIKEIVMGEAKDYRSLPKMKVVSIDPDNYCVKMERNE